MGRFYPSERKLPHRDEQRHAQGEAPPYRSRKDRKRWCKGKPGVPHQLEIGLSKMGLYLAERHGHTCHWQPGGWSWSHRAHPDRPGWYWTCAHQRACTVCGKVLDPFLPPAECPLYTLDIPEVTQ